MIIEAVELENFLSHRLTRLRLGRGIIAIVGPNGAGKTSIIDAITFALFDTHSRGNIRKDGLISLGASRARIAVSFRVGSKTYELVKVIGRGAVPTQAKLYLVEDGGKKLVAQGVRNVEREINSILGFDAKLASLLLVTKQGEIESILTDKTKRMDLIASLLKIKEMDKAHDRVRELLRDVDRKLSFNSGRLRELEQSLKRLRAEVSQLEPLYRRLDELEEKLKSKRGMLETVTRELSDLERKLLAYKSLEKDYEHLRRRLEELDRRIEMLRREYEEAKRAGEELREYEEKLQVAEKLRKAQKLLERMREGERLREQFREKVEELKKVAIRIAELTPIVRDYEATRARVDELRRAYEEYLMLKRRREELARELEELNSQLREAYAKIRRELESEIPLKPPDDIGRLDEFLDSVIEDVERRIEHLQVKLREASDRRGAIRKSMEQVEDVLLKLTSARGKCPLCGQPLTEEHRMKLISKFRAERRKLEADLASVEAEVRRVQGEIERLRRVRERLRSLKNRVGRIVQAIVAAEEAKARLEDEVRNVNRRELELLPRAKEFEDLKARLARLEESYREYISLRGQLERLKKDVRALAEALRGLERVRVELEELLGELNISLDEVEKFAEEVQHVYTAYGELRSKASNLPSIEAELRSITAEREAVAGRLRDVESKLKELGGVEEEYERVKKLFEELSNEVRRLESEAASIKARIEVLEERKAEIARIEAEVEKLKSRVERYKAARDFLEKFRRLLSPDGIPRIVRQAAKGIIEYNLREILSAFNIEFNDVRLDDDYNVILITRHGEKTIGMLSGGERIALAIAYRLALARMVGSRIEAMIMDEPTVHLDAERRRELVNIIRHSLESTGLSQLIVVTHDREVEDAADTVIEVEKGHDGRSIVRVAA